VQKKWKLTILIGAVICLMLGTWHFNSYRVARFHGAGIISDAGFWSYPRYHVEFDTIPASRNETYQFSFAGLPAEDMSLILYLPGKTESDRPSIVKLQSEIVAKLADDQSHVLCNVSGHISDGLTDSSWILTSSTNSAALYQRACTDIPMHTNRTYTLTLSVVGADLSSTTVSLKPYLSGGGNELP
jgi:hypothetical protein